MAKQRRKKEACPNCQFQFEQSHNFCPNCGQENHDKKVAIKLLFSDFLADFFTWDSKFLRSMIPLLFRPGNLTKEFLDGKRIRFVRPFRMYIFVSFLYFFVFHFVDKTYESTGDGNVQTTLSPTNNDGGLTLTFTPPEQDSITDTMSSEFFQQEHIKSMLDSLGPDAFVDSLNIEDPEQREMTRKIIRSVTEDREQFLQFFEKNISIMLFFFIPIFAGILFLFFFAQAKYFVEHLIFAVHYQTFVFLSGLVFLLSGFIHYEVYDQIVQPLIFIPVCWVYLLLAIKKVYGESWGITVVKWVAVSIIYVLMLLVLLICTAMLSFMYL